ncbi:hypothetical protein [Pseudomonas fluorescens]|uniref:Uncharacterized protein n=1 Tax=Pseudomonas fluorescens TaxID=294 RepID=A0A5E6VM82_PSEFL|nr:hypothetical protein [Pseudomonas fluorescens]VVN18790.1 hypothetical protein PS655_04236 [Pseudomonas fluorescens]
MSLLSQLEELQWKQLQHDEKYHKEIWVLNVQQRITHMVLHLSKYSAKLTLSALEHNIEELKKATIDSLIIVTSSTNIFNKLLSDFAVDQSEKDLSDINALASKLLKEESFDGYEPNISMAIKVNSLTGRMCKAVESLDHLEAYPFKETLLDSLASIFRILLALACHLRIGKIEEPIENRLYSVEKNNIFFSRLGNYKSGY